MKKYLIYLLKIAVSIAFIWLLFSKVDIHLFAKEIQEARLGWILLAIFAMTISWMANTSRWKALLVIFSIKARFFTLFLYNLISVFYTLVLPGGKIMGDLVRGYRVAHDHQGERQEKNQLFLLTFIDRGIGVLAFLMVVSVFFVIQHPAVSFLGQSSAVVGIVILVGVILGLGFIFSGIFDWFLLLIQKIPLTPLKKIVTSLLLSFRSCRGNKRQLLKSLAFSLTVVLLSAASVYAINKALDLEIDYWTIIFFNSLTVILVMIPITVGGIGLREGGLTYLLVQYGIDPAKALALSFLNLCFDIFLFALLGGLAEFYYHFLGGKNNLQKIQKNDTAIAKNL